MINSPVLDTAIGLIFIFLLYSLLATSVNEAIATLFALRARMLKKGIIDGMLSGSKHKRWILDNTLKSIGNTCKEFVFSIIGYKPKEKGKLGNHFYDHPLIKNYGCTNRFSIPSYLSKETFSDILIEVLKDYAEDHKTEIEAYITANFPQSPGFDALPPITKIDYLVQYLQSVTDESLKEEFKKKGIYIDHETLQILALYLEKSGQAIETFTLQLQTWFEDSMSRISGWYKRQVQFTLFYLGIIIAITFNVDILDISGKLSTDKDARSKLVEIALRDVDALKDDPRVQKTSTDLTKNTDSIPNQVYANEVENIKSELNGDIKDANNLLALGWGDYGFKKDSISIYAKYGTEIKHLETAIKKDNPVPPKNYKDSTVYYNQEAVKALYDKHWIKLKVCYILDASFHGRKMIGFLLLAFGICLGAPFWFDLLQKIVQLRATGKKEEPGKTAPPAAPPVQLTINNSTNPNVAGN
ncbi:hypothetical protein [Flavobacterium humi]|uniref:Uncharacterized protein n=1 Tax=Flavobacterium humi TaxID=2562683 RepID=A0A4Z0LC06_9FLAO|nr:hypothetical protein [Flavobacterium humi]TGD59420.1 hypothetical protein E4635_00350 [Flavobacterium humi]